MLKTCCLFFFIRSLLPKVILLLGFQSIGVSSRYLSPCTLIFSRLFVSDFTYWFSRAGGTFRVYKSVGFCCVFDGCLKSNQCDWRIQSTLLRVRLNSIKKGSFKYVGQLNSTKTCSSTRTSYATNMFPPTQNNAA